MPRRIWQTDSGTVCLRDATEADNLREFWVPSGGGYVYEIDANHPGTSGQQVCEMLSNQGRTLRSRQHALEHLIRNEYRKAIRRYQKQR